MDRTDKDASREAAASRPAESTDEPTLDTKTGLHDDVARADLDFGTGSQLADALGTPSVPLPEQTEPVVAPDTGESDAVLVPTPPGPEASEIDAPLVPTLPEPDSDDREDESIDG